MARCGRCGLWESYPKDHPEQMWAGSCLWYQTRLTEGYVYEKRECDDFFERFPSMSPKEHFDYKIKRDGTGDSYKAARRSLFFSAAALGLSVLGFLL